MANATESSSLPSLVDTPSEESPAPALTGERVSSGSDVTVMPTDLITMVEILVKKFALVDEMSLQLKDQATGIDLMEKLVKERERKVELREKSVEELKLKLSQESIALEKEKKESMEEIERKQEEWIEKKRKESEDLEHHKKVLDEKDEQIKSTEKTINEEVNEMNKKLKEMEGKEKELKEKVNELEKRILEARAMELEWRSKYLDERQRQLEGRSILQGESSIRSRLKRVAEKSSEFNFSTPPVKRQRPLEDSVPVASACASFSQFIAEPPHGEEDLIAEGDEGGVVSLNDDSDEEEEEAEPITVPESQFHDFTKNIDSFEKGQVWALYDGLDGMPRLYGQIKKVVKSQLSLKFRWIEPRNVEEGGSVSCGRFKFGTTETQSYSIFSHQMHRMIQGRYLIKMYPKQGETWAMFRDWKNNDTEQDKTPPYEYDFGEILFDFNDEEGVRVAHLGKVDGFVSLFERRAAQNGLVRHAIPPVELHRFSHRVPSVRLSGDEGEGVPAGSFELDPAALPSSLLQSDESIHEEEAATKTAREDEHQGGSRNDDPIIIILD